MWPHFCQMADQGRRASEVDGEAVVSPSHHILNVSLLVWHLVLVLQCGMNNLAVSIALLLVCAGTRTSSCRNMTVGA